MVNRREFVRSSFDPERAVSVGQNRGFSVEMQRRFALVCEHEALFGAIRSGKHINTMKTCADSCFVAIAGREAAYAGKRIKTAWFKEKSQLSLLPENLSLDGKKPIAPIPNPTQYKLV